MTEMTPEKYMKERLDDQIVWYDGKSSRNQVWYKSLRTAEIILAASIPFMVGYIQDGHPSVAFAVGAAGAVIVVISSILALNKYQENWIEFRTTCESLRQHKFRFLTKAEPYTGDDAFQTLVDNVESLISKENRNWSEYIRMQAGERGDGQGNPA